MPTGQVTRGTQTVVGVGRGCQTTSTTHTQTTTFHPTLMMPHNATIITPRIYSPAFTYDVAKVSLIQRLLRGCLARKRVRLMRQALAREAGGREVEEEVVEYVGASSPITTITSTPTTSPQRTRGNRGVPLTELYARLESWRRREVGAVNETLKGRERRAALVALLEKETHLLRSLEAHRAARSLRRRNQAVTAFLYQVSQAQVWQVCGGRVQVEVETPDSRPVRTLAGLATSLLQDVTTTEQRATHLNSLIHTVENYRPSYQGEGVGVVGDGSWAGLKVAREVVTLAGRGLHLLSRGTSDARLRGLRKRLHTLIITYLQLVQTRAPSVLAPRTLRTAGALPVLPPSSHHA